LKNTGASSVSGVLRQCAPQTPPYKRIRAYVYVCMYKRIQRN